RRALGNRSGSPGLGCRRYRSPTARSPADAGKPTASTGLRAVGLAGRAALPAGRGSGGAGGGPRGRPPGGGPAVLGAGGGGPLGQPAQELLHLVAGGLL